MYELINSVKKVVKQVLANKDASPFLCCCVMVVVIVVVVIVIMVVVVIFVTVVWMHMNCHYFLFFTLKNASLKDGRTVGW